jgi:predicted lipoprotein with Yx(FWY)xxD motif
MRRHPCEDRSSPILLQEILMPLSSVRARTLLLPLLLCASISTVALSGCAAIADWRQAGKSPVMLVDGVMVGPGAMTLYTFDRDTAGSGASACLEQCAVNWPPLLAAGDARTYADWSLVQRPGGARQWAFKGQPLYYWAKDAKPGDRTGDGVNSVWRIARP